MSPYRAFQLGQQVAGGGKLDDRINRRGGVRWTSGELASVNTLALLRSKRRRGVYDFRSYLHQLAHEPRCASNPEKRAAFARRWLRRLA